jgi:ATP-dependent HslUV protease, peptidase subunit HslV
MKRVVDDEASRIRSTTVLAVRKGTKVVIGGDGQVSMGNTVMKGTARKVRRMHDSKVIAGFAGSAADGISLFERLESKLQSSGGNLTRACVDLAKDWRTDRILRRLEALLIVADVKNTYLLSGTGDIIEPDEGLCSIGSGGPYALAAGRALALHTQLGAREICEAALKIAGDICIYTNQNLTFEELGT